MSTTPSPDEPSNDQEVLDRLFGGPVRKDQPSAGLVWYLGPALLATVVFWVLTSLKGEIWLKAVTFFIIILAIDIFFTNWRRTHPEG